MGVNLKGRSFVKLLDFTKSEISYLLTLSKDLKSHKRQGITSKVLNGKNVCLIFQKDSTRTRCSFENGAADLGMHPVYLGPSGSQFGKKESVEDSAKVLGRLFDGIQFRGFKQSDVELLAKHSGVPVWNGLTDEFHPTQILADFLTIQENHGEDLRGVKLVFIGDARNNMGNSLMVGAAIMGMNFVAVAPKELWPDTEIINKCKALAKNSGGSIEITSNKLEGVKDAHAIYTDVWVSMGENDWTHRLELLNDYQVDMKTIKAARKDVIFMHCLPAFHNLNTDISFAKSKEYSKRFPKLINGEFEVTNEVFNSKHSVVFDEAENRLHTIKAIMLATIGT